MKFARKDLVLSLSLILFTGCGGGGSDTTQIQKVDETPTKTTDPNKENLTTTSTKPKISAPTKDRVFYISKKIEYKPDENITTRYIYKNSLLNEVDTSSTSGVTTLKTYKYFQDNKVVKSYDESGLVTDVATFQPLKDPNHRYIYDRRLSLDMSKQYLLSTYDSLIYGTKSHLVKRIDILLAGSHLTYDDKDNLLKIEDGSFELNQQNSLEDDINTSFLLDDKILKFTPNQESNYIYDGSGVLKKVEFDTTTSNLTADIKTSFYQNGQLQDLNISTGDSFHYDKNGLLKTKTRTIQGQKIVYNYTYSSDLKTVTVKNANGVITQQYTFSELK
jgi:hypothetical protein